jgi:hypothetical protein
VKGGEIVASIYHSRRDLAARHDHSDHLAVFRAIVGGLMAIALLVALVAGIAGAAVYGLVMLLTMLFQ